jgi:hypothetical protein
MVRRKTATELTRARLALAERLVILRTELFGERGGPEMAMWLGVPARTWYSYERGVVIPGPLILKIIVATTVEPGWLLHGTGPKFRRPELPLRDTSPQPVMTVSSLLRLALRQLDAEHAAGSNPREGLGVDGIVNDDAADATGRSYDLGTDQIARRSA